MKTLDVMVEIPKMNLYNIPIVAFDLVTFLSLSTGFNAIEILVVENTKLKDDIVELKKLLLVILNQEPPLHFFDGLKYYTVSLTKKISLVQEALREYPE